MDATGSAAPEPLTFSVMEARLSALPDLSEGARRRAWPLRLAAVVMVVGLVLGLTPSFLLATSLPQSWLLAAARSGLALAIAGFLPLLVYNGYILVKELRGWVLAQARGMDHQRNQFTDEIAWLRSFPADELRSMLDYARYSYHRRASRISLISGSAEKLGLLPVLASLFILFRGGGDPFAISGWMAALGFLLSFFWLICWIATLARGRLQTYEFLLEAALKE